MEEKSNNLNIPVSAFLVVALGVCISIVTSISQPSEGGGTNIGVVIGGIVTIIGGLIQLTKELKDANASAREEHRRRQEYEALLIRSNALLKDQTTILAQQEETIKQLAGDGTLPKIRVTYNDVHHSKFNTWRVVFYVVNPGPYPIHYTQVRIRDNATSMRRFIKASGDSHILDPVSQIVQHDQAAESLYTNPDPVILRPGDTRQVHITAAKNQGTESFHIIVSSFQNEYSLTLKISLTEQNTPIVEMLELEQNGNESNILSDFDKYAELLWEQRPKARMFTVQINGQDEGDGILSGYEPKLEKIQTRLDLLASETGSTSEI